METLEEKRASELGLSGRAIFINAPCPNCGGKRWVSRIRVNSLCKPCAEKQKSLNRKLKIETLSGREVINAKYIGIKGGAYYYKDNCPECGKEMWRERKHIGSKCISCADHSKPRGVNSPHWKGGSVTAQGYVSLTSVYEDNAYFSMVSKNGKILQHRLVMAEKLGRPLKDWEIVHHINGIRTDNRIENLELLPNDAQNTLYAKVQAIENELSDLRKLVNLLLWHNNLLQQANPEPSRDVESPACVEHRGSLSLKEDSGMCRT